MKTALDDSGMKPKERVELMVFQSRKVSIPFCLCLAVLWTSGCSELEVKKSSIKRPVISDQLHGVETIGKMTGGEFTKDGWKPGADGAISYDLPGMPQGRISITLAGLSRSVPETIFLTLYEPAELEYPDPFILLNPYRITLALNNFQESPDSPFEWLWTIKNFDPATPNEARYTAELPGGDQVYQKTVSANRTPIFPDETYTITMEWKNGKAVLYLNRTVIAEQRYAPVLFNPKALKLVIGKSPGIETFGMRDVTFKKIEVTFPGMK